MGKAEILLALANEVAAHYDDLFETKGPGPGNRATNDFVGELQKAASDRFGRDFSEATVCGSNKLAVDYYFPDEATIVEVAFGLRNPKTEFEKDILKALIAKSHDNPVKRLFFIAKPGGHRKCRQPGRSEFVTWLEEKHGITVEVRDLDVGHG